MTEDTRSEKTSPSRTSLPTDEERTIDAKLFLSYNHDDNNLLGGKIVDLAKLIAKNYRFLTGHDVSLFIDSDSISWGDDWQRILHDNIASADFFMPALTPSYMTSPACRKEYQQFASRLSTTSQKKILPLLWQSIPAGSQNNTDSIFESIQQTQWENVESLQELSQSSPEYQKRARTIAKRLATVISNRQSVSISKQLPDSLTNLHGNKRHSIREKETLPHSTDFLKDIMLITLSRERNERCSFQQRLKDCTVD